MRGLLILLAALALLLSVGVDSAQTEKWNEMTPQQQIASSAETPVNPLEEIVDLLDAGIEEARAHD